MEALILVIGLTALVIAVGGIVRFIGAIFSSEDWERIREHPFLHALWFIVTAVTALVIASFFLPALSTPPSVRMAVRTKVVAWGLVRAMEAYHTQCEQWPLQSSTNEDHSYQADYLQLMDTLGSKNLRGTVFYDFQPRYLDKNDDYRDPWHDRYNVIANWKGDGEIVVGANRVHAGVVVWSNGRNGINEFGDGDDTASWK